jgi:hypothetical protein
MTAPILHVQQEWYCAFCPQTDVTSEARPHSRLHACPGKAGITMPFVRVGTKAKVEVREREDYVGQELVRVDANGRPIMSVVTTRDDGMDTIVFAPAARASLKEMR